MTLKASTVNMNISLGEVLPTTQYLGWLADPEVTRYLEGGGFYTLDSLQFYVEARKRDSLFYGIYADGVYVGNIKVGTIRPRHHNGDLGLMIGDRAYWGKGVGTRAVELMKGVCRDWDFHVLTAGIIDDHPSSHKLFLKCGFQHVGTFHEFRWLEGRWHDELLYQIVLG